MCALAACLLPAFAFAQDPRIAALDELLRRYAGNGWSGAALVAEEGRVLLARGYGFADFERARVNASDTLFEVASLTKSFTAAAVVRLAQLGRLDLEDSIAVHLPGVPAHSRGITLRQLLSHTSGVPGHNASGRGEDLAKAVVDYLGTGPEREPGSRLEYWNGGYALLAGVIERASGRPYTRCLEEELFAPAGMSDSGFTGDGDLDAERAARGSSIQGPARSALEHPYGAYGYQYRGMGGLVTSVSDLWLWDRALAGHALLDEAHTSELFTPVMKDYALGWRISRAVDGGVRQSHGGSVRGFVCDFRRLPERNACIAVLCNADDARPSEIAENLECLLLGRPPSRPPPPGRSLSDAEAAAYAGAFVGECGRLSVRAAPGVLMAGIEGQGLLDALEMRGQLDWNADLVELGTRAVRIVEGIARGDTEPLRTHMAPRIPRSWPDTMRSRIWPEHLGQHGELRGARPLGAVAREGRVEVLLALEHAGGAARALLAFGPAGLERLDWRGPQFPASARLEPVRRGIFRLHVPGRAEGARRKVEFDLQDDSARTARIAGLELVRN
jgi:CubicO group peptidase (beta-lactamase class C family)